MSPSPSLPDDPDLPPRTKSTSPEPLPESDIVQMRRAVLEMRHIHKPDVHLTRREKELADMVLRLTTAVRPDPDQLLRQADMISALTQQRDLLLHQTEEQRLRWNSEKDGWARMAEALLAQQAKNRLNSGRDEDFSRLYVVETDNKGLRQRLNETQSRLHVLESELTRLRPLLLMQPLISRSSLPPPTPNPKTQHARRRKRDAAATEDETHGSSGDEPPGDTPSHPSQSQVTPRPKSRKSEVLSNVHSHTNPSKRRPSQKTISRGLSADARVEHLLLAARRIGKHRAGITSGMVQRLEERERERRREDSAATAVAGTPKTPKRITSHTAYPPEGAYVYFGGQVRPGAGMQPVPMFIPAYPHHLLQTPSSSTTAPSAASSAQQSAQKPKQDAKSNNPPTPLDSLLTAARSLMRQDIDVSEDEDEEVDIVGDSPGSMAGARHAQPKGTLGSPISKRRKVAARTDRLTATSRSTNNPSSSPANASGATDSGPGRIRSALDVLADQAAAFGSQEQPATPHQMQTRTKGKGKERADLQPQEPSGSTPKPRGRIKSRRKESEAGTPTPSPAVPMSRGGTPRSDVGDNPACSTHRIAQPRVGGSALEVPVDPGGGTSGASTYQMLDSGNRATTSHDARSPRSSDKALYVDDSADATPKPGSRTRDLLVEGGLEGTRATTVEPSFARLPPESPMPEAEHREALPPPPPPRTEAAPPAAQNGRSSAPAKNKELVQVVELDVPASAAPTKRPRSPYVKWSKEEDDLLAQAVAKYGQKWDLVQKALPSRGYHQVRQRWLRKLGVFDSKPDLSVFQTAATATYASTSLGDGVEPRGNPKLGLAPLSSEKTLSGVGSGPRPSSLPL